MAGSKSSHKIVCFNGTNVKPCNEVGQKVVGLLDCCQQGRLHKDLGQYYLRTMKETVGEGEC